MNTAALKKYAPKARLAFMAAVRARAEKLGLNPKQPAQVQESGQVYLINGQPHEARVGKQRETLLQRIEQQGYEPFIESLAYTWFNRFAAIRYMELHGFLDHGYRVLSHPSGGPQPEIMEQVQHLELPGLDKQKALELKLDGTQDEALYRELLLAQCHALHEAMPFLFEALDDATELLLPDNLTRTDSVIRELVTSIPEADWQDVEIIGWLYQFYISEKKDQVMGKVVKSADIPAATQLFTPNWIVQYLVQNSLGRLWLQSHPNSPVQQAMPYYVPPGEQPAEVQAQIAAHTPDSLNPEHIKVLDPACGSGHILLEAYKLLKQLYEERGYRNRDIPQLILKRNIFGLDIDDRAGQLAGFSLMMLARADDRRLFERIAEGEVTLNILALQESSHLDPNALWRALNLSKSWQQGTSQNLFDDAQADLSTAQADNRYQLLTETLARFKGAKTFGSLIEVPQEQAQPLAELTQELEQLATQGDVMQKPAALQLLPFVKQAWLLAQRYDAVIANPPYMGGKGMNSQLKDFAKKAYPNSKSDLFAIFMERAFTLLKSEGFNAQVNMQSWMFLSSYEKLRAWLLQNATIITMAHLGARAFDSIGGEVVSTTAFVISNQAYLEYQGAYIRLVDGRSEAEKKQMLLEAIA